MTTKCYFSCLCIYFILSLNPAHTLDLSPGSSELITFPDLPQTAAKKESAVKIWLPDNYNTEQTFPMFLWFHGNTGGQGGNPKLVKNRDFISLGMPLYKKNMKEYILLKPHDVQFAWEHYKVMFDKVFELIPNIQKHGGLVGGFSNGAHNTGMLLTEGDPIFNTWFNSYIFWEGGYIIKDYSLLKDRHSIWIMGDKSITFKTMPAQVAVARQEGSHVVDIVMKNVGHKMDPEYRPQVMDWIENKVVLGKVYEQHAVMKKALQSNKYAVAAVAAFYVAHSAREHMPERAEAQKALQNINSAAEQAYQSLQGKDPDSDDLKEFIQQWPHTTAADNATKPLNKQGQADLQKILESKRPQRALEKFIADWQGFKAGDEAQNTLDKLAQSDLDAALAEEKIKDRVKELFAFAKDWELASQASRVPQIFNQLAKDELDRIAQMSDAKDKSKELKNWGKIFSKSIHAERALQMMKDAK